MVLFGHVLDSRLKKSYISEPKQWQPLSFIDSFYCKAVGHVLAKT